MAVSRKGAKRRSQARRGRRVPSLDEILRTLRSRLPELREKYSIKTLAIFGSYARNKQRAKSDLDLLVEFEKTPGLIQFIRIEDELGNLLGVKVDLVSRPALRADRDATGNILREAVQV